MAHARRLTYFDLEGLLCRLFAMGKLLLGRPLAAFVLFGLLVTNGCQKQAVDWPNHRVTVALDGSLYHLELALDNDARLQGLSDRQTLADDGGMLFVFPVAHELQFVMRRCSFPIDIIFIGPGGRIVAMHEMQVEPANTQASELRQYGSQWVAQFAIELPAGSLKKAQLKLGQTIYLPWNDLKQHAK